jgi:hypothetical protein
MTLALPSLANVVVEDWSNSQKRVRAPRPFSPT